VLHGYTYVDYEKRSPAQPQATATNQQDLAQMNSGSSGNAPPLMN
jgi:hypothetical protein